MLIDAYFSATKIKWIIDNVPKARDLIRKKRLLFGTVDCFLLWRLTKGVDHATDATNASRTMLFNISTNKWDDQILKILKIPKEILPVVKDCAADFGYTDPITYWNILSNYRNGGRSAISIYWPMLF